MQWRRESRRACWAVLAAIVVLLAVAGPALGYSITGKVTAFAGGQAVTDCELQLWKLGGDGTSWIRPGIYAEPAADGSYSLNFSDDGTYRVQCYNSPIYAEQWWHEVADPQDATALTVPGAVLTDIDFSLLSNKTASALVLSAPSTCAYGAVSMTGSLTAEGLPLAGRDVRIESYSADTWQQVGSVKTDATGAYAVQAAPASTTTYRAVFDGDPTYAEATSANAQVTPKASLTKPSAPKTARTTKSFIVSCLLKPQHPAGTYPLSFQCRHYERGKWVTKLTVKAKAGDVIGASKCSARIRLKLKGSWRIVAVHKTDEANAATTSAWRAVSVK